jgi:hypothetical protein
MLADTIAVDSSEIDTGEQTPARRGDATASLPGGDVLLDSRSGPGRHRPSGLRPAKIGGLARLLLGVALLAAAVVAGLAMLDG